MKIVGFRYCFRQLNFFLGTVYHLQNWRELRQGAKRERRGEILVQPAVLKFRNGLKIEMGPGSYANHDFLFREIFLEKCYQPTPDFVPRQGWTVVDLGANMGFFTCQAAFAAADVRVISVEPIYTEILRKNIAANRFANALVVPDEDLYEQGVFPSRFNDDHKATFTISKSRSWSAKSINVLELANSLPGGQLVSLQLQDHDYNRRLMSFGKQPPGLLSRFLAKAHEVASKLMNESRLTGLRRFLTAYYAVDQTSSPFNAQAQIQLIVRKVGGNA